MTVSARGAVGGVQGGGGGADALFAGPGEVRALARALDWSATPLGRPAAWSPALRTATRAMLEAPVPICLWAGLAYVLLYNDAYAAMLGAKHPAAFGRPAGAVWGEVWPELEPQFAQVRGGGPPVFAEDARFATARLEGDETEEGWFSHSLSALRDEGGAVVAVLNIAAETTARAERADGTERGRLLEVFRRVPSFVSVVTGPDHVLAYANEAYFTLVGRRDILGRPVWEALPDARGQGFEALLDGVRDTGVSVVGREAPLRLVRTPGAEPEERFVDFVYQALVDAAGNRWGVMGHGTDVTESVRARREVERLLAESEAANAQLQEQALELELSNQQLQDQAAELEVQAEELRATAAELEERSEDAEEARVGAEAERARTAAVLSSIADAFYLLDREWRFTHVNTAAEPLLQTTAGALVGRTLWEAFPGVAGSVFEGPYREAMATGRVTSAEAYFAPLGTWFDVRTYPWSGGLMVHFRDVGARKAAEAEREQLLADAEAARAEAEGANRAKAEFLATMSHELRTPINGVLGYAGLLELGVAGPLTDEQRGYLERLAASGRHLLGLVSDVLDLAKVDAGAARVAHEDGTTGPVVRAALDVVAPAAAARGVRLVDALPDEAGVEYVGDEDRVRQVAVNLLSNAVKFTGAGGTVTVTCDTVPEAPPAAAHLKGGGPWALIRVEDTGVGIPPEEQGRIFDEFHQVQGGKTSYTRTAGGTGLGLAISRRLARLMGGDLSVESAPGVGSAFTLWLPASRGDGASAAAGETATDRAARAERDVSRLETPGLGEVGAVLHAAVDEVLAAYTDRLRADPAVPRGAGMTRIQLEDHAISFLADLAQSLVIVGDAGPEGAELLKAGSAIQRTIAEEHGARRHAQGWGEAALRRDQRVFREEVERAVRARLKAGSGDVDEAVRVLLALLERGEAISVRAWRRAAAEAAR